MTERVLHPLPLSAEEFAPFGDVIEVSGTPDKIINQGMCDRYHNLAQLEFADGEAGISLFDAKARHFPYVVDMVERHPKGSQAFIPISDVPMLVVVAEDDRNKPVNLRVFLTGAAQAINLHRGVWHGVLAPMGASGVYAVVDRIGEGGNLEEYWFDVPFVVKPR